MQKPKTGLAMFFGILLLLLSVVMLGFYFKYNNEYVKNGTPVNATITEVSVIGRHHTYYGRYTNKDGDVIQAQITPNDFAVSVGDKFTGYIRDDEPEKVYCEPALMLKLFGGGIIGFLVFIGVLIIFVACNSKRKYDALKKNGKHTTGEVMSVQRQSDGNGDRFYLVSVRFYEENGTEHLQQYIIRRSVPMIGQKYQIYYTHSKNGTLISDLLEI